MACHALATSAVSAPRGVRWTVPFCFSAGVWGLKKDSDGKKRKRFRSFLLSCGEELSCCFTGNGVFGGHGEVCLQFAAAHSLSAEQNINKGLKLLTTNWNHLTRLV